MGCRLLVAAVVAAAALIAAAANCAAAAVVAAPMLHELPDVLDDDVAGLHWSAWYRGCAVQVCEV